MIEMATIVWFTAGSVAGVLRATILWRATQRLTAWTPVLGMLRLGVVAAVLFAAARSGAILVATDGWLLGFVTVSTWLVGCRENRTVRSSNAHSDQ